MSNKQYTEQEVEAWQAFYDPPNPHTLKETADEFAPSQPTIRRRIETRSISETHKLMGGPDNKISEATRDRAAELYKKLRSSNAVADRMEISAASVRNIVRRRGLTKTRVTFRGETVTVDGAFSAETARGVLRDYYDGMKRAKVAERHGVSVSTVTTWAERAGIKRTLRTSQINHYVREGRMSAVARQKRAAKMYRNETCIGDIAEELGVCHHTVRRDLEREGVELRSQRETNIIAHWGSMERYRRFCRRAALRYNVRGETFQTIADDEGVARSTVERAVYWWEEQQTGAEERLTESGQTMKRRSQRGLTEHKDPRKDFRS